jgi:hypothetical protein
VWFYIQAKDRKKTLPWLAAGLTVLILCDLWTVDKRYLNVRNFLNPRQHSEQEFAKTPADEMILQDTTLSYRVLNLNNPFNESRTAYYHKAIGGYHAAKLRRYQDLIDRRITKEMQSIIASLQTAQTLADIQPALAQCSTLNMLNTKYIIYNPAQPPLFNPYADGNAWFVQSYRFTDTPDEEMAALETLNPKTEAVLDRQFEPNLADLQLVPDSTARITMTLYTPPRVEYRSSSAHKGLAVFSEVYYKNGWKAFIDGKPVPISRADWTLRALVVPAGEHHIEMVFDPDDIRTAGTVTTIFSGLLLLLVVGSLVFWIYKSVKR